MRGGKASRQKGNRAERDIGRFLQERGFAAERVPLSGSAGGSYLGDLTVPVIGIDRGVGVKCCADGFRELYSGSPSRSQRTARCAAPQACRRDRGEGGWP